MKVALKKSIDKTLCLGPLQVYSRAQATRRLTVLAYHGVTDQDRFTAHLDYIHSHMQPVCLGDVLQGFDTDGLPDRATLITFDDNDKSVLTVAAPLLQARNLPAIAFVVAGLLHNGEPHWFEEIEALTDAGGRTAQFGSLNVSAMIAALKKMPDDERLSILNELRSSVFEEPVYAPKLSVSDLRMLESAGIEIGNHTLTHPLLPRCSAEKVQEEIRSAHHVLTLAASSPPRAFAYPNGDSCGEALTALRRTGYKAAFLFDHQANRLPLKDRLLISRVRVDSNASLDRFRLIMSGLHPALHSIRRPKDRKSHDH